MNGLEPCGCDVSVTKKTNIYQRASVLRPRACCACACWCTSCTSCHCCHCPKWSSRCCRQVVLRSHFARELLYQEVFSLHGMPARGPTRSLSRMVGCWVAALQLTNGGVVNAVVPCGPLGNSSAAWVDDRTSCGLECWTTPLVRDDSGRSHLMSAQLG